MPHTIVAAQPPAIVMTRVWMHEHDWLHSVYASHANQSPTFRFPDLLSACIELVLSRTESLARLQLFLGTELGARDPKAPRRSCHVWRRQFDELLRANRKITGQRLRIDVGCNARQRVFRIESAGVTSEPERT